VNYSCFPPLLMYPRAITLGVATKKEMEVRPYDHPLLLNPAGFALLQFYTDNPNVATVTVRTEVRQPALDVRLLIGRSQSLIVLIDHCPGAICTLHSKQAKGRALTSR